MHSRTRVRTAFAAFAAISLVARTAMAVVPTAQPSEEEAHRIAVEAYVYLYPLISMDVTRRQATNVQADTGAGRAPANSFSHVRKFPDANWRDVVRPNFDTLYSLAWVDLSTGPVVIGVPDTQERYYLLPMLDMWSDVFAVPGSRTTGTTAHRFVLVPPKWSGSVPGDADRIDAPTPYVWIIGRTQTNGPSDYDAVRRVQDGFSIAPLGPRSGATIASVDPGIDMKTAPLTQVNSMPAVDYFSYGARLMGTNPPHASDWSIVARMKRIGIVAGQPLAVGSNPERKRTLESAAKEGLKAMRDKLPTMARVVNGWQMNTDTMGVYGNYYLKRAIIAMVGLGANQPDDAVYPLLIADADGKPLDGSSDYLLHFDKAQLPPVGAFWSLTMYDQEGFQVANPINRFAIGDRDKLRFNDDGSLDLYIQHQSPGSSKESNWLPAPASGTLGLTMRLYAPRPEVIDGRWSPPAVKRVR